MAENVRKLAKSESFRGLQEKVNYWAKEYNTNSCDENLNYCIGLIEQVAKVQAQLFGILTVTAQEGGRNEGVETIKGRLLPLLENSFSSVNMLKLMEAKDPSAQDAYYRDKNRETGFRDPDQKQSDSDHYQDNPQNQVQDELKSLQAQEDARHKNSENRRTESSKSERRGISGKRTGDARSAETRGSDTRNTETTSEYEKHLQNLKDEISGLSAEKSGLQGSRSHSRSRSKGPCTTVAKVRSPSPNRSKMSTETRKAALLSRFSDAYSQARLDAQCLLRRCIDRAETVQRIIYIATVEAFHVAKMSFRHFKIRVRKMLTPSNMGTNDFENAVMDYIVCHLDLYDAQGSVNDVIRAMNVNPKISFPPEVDFCVLSDFIQEICCIAFAMQSLNPPLDIAFGADGEVFNDCKYHRSYDSDFTAPLVFYHVWPALMENDCVIMKGEAVTRRGAFVRWPCIVTIHPLCLIHKFENIYKPKDSIKRS
ncbi:Spermatogenesis-associated protein 18 [Cricetulus griseus]|uniref:Mitochondria-eating protein n=1 Tax=Cricetulus griseus TaxID=10029 RepID=G3IAA4_CRIGR|nr:Spermatogenesis-associated protein 18 [Cricetulus griseus]